MSHIDRLYEEFRKGHTFGSKQESMDKYFHAFSLWLDSNGFILSPDRQVRHHGEYGDARDFKIDQDGCGVCCDREMILLKGGVIVTVPPPADKQLDTKTYLWVKGDLYGCTFCRSTMLMDLGEPYHLEGGGYSDGYIYGEGANVRYNPGFYGKVISEKLGVPVGMYYHKAVI